MPATWGPAVQLEPEVTLTSLCLLDTFNHCVSVSAKSHSGAGRLEENSTDTNPPELRLLPNKLPFPHSALSLISLLPSPLVLEILKSHFVGFQKKKGKWKPTQPILTALVKHPIPADRGLEPEQNPQILPFVRMAAPRTPAQSQIFAMRAIEMNSKNTASSQSGLQFFSKCSYKA